MSFVKSRFHCTTVLPKSRQKTHHPSTNNRGTCNVAVLKPVKALECCSSYLLNHFGTNNRGKCNFVLVNSVKALVHDMLFIF